MLTYDLTAKGNKTMYAFLYESMKEDILNGRLAAGERLPSKRTFAQHLGVSVKTVENAYEQLLLEGYIRAEEKRGYYVTPIQKTPSKKSSYEFFATRFHEDEYLADLTANNIRYDRFPYTTWAKTIRETLADYDTDLLKVVPFNGVERLRIAIADHLYHFRGMDVSPDHIVVGAGTEYLYSRLLQLLGEDGTWKGKKRQSVRFGIENPGYRKITGLYDSANVDWDYVDIDEKGIRVDQLTPKGITAVHVSPEHQVPIGFAMPVDRRQELLAWAGEAKERYIVEDDFDCEFRMVGRPIPSLQSMDHSNRVIYMNTFSKTMVPSLRMGYMVLPERLMERYVSTMHFYSATVSGLEQHAMAAFMEKGHFDRHIRRLVNDYKAQREKICRMFRESALSAISSIYEDDAGTHFLWKVTTPLSDVEIKWAARQRGILVKCLSEYCFADADRYRGILVIHYSDMSDEVLEKVIKAFEDIFLGTDENWYLSMQQM